VQLHGCERWLTAQAATAPTRQNSIGKLTRIGGGSLQRTQIPCRNSMSLSPLGPGSPTGQGTRSLPPWDAKPQVKVDAIGATRLHELAIEAMSNFVKSVGSSVIGGSDSKQQTDSKCCTIQRLTVLCISLLHSICSPLKCEGYKVRTIFFSLPLINLHSIQLKVLNTPDESCR
jgi:hypothetical protein